LDLILLFGLGWLVAYFFYRRHKTETQKLFDKLNHDARNFILSDPRTRLGLTDIIDLFHEKIINEHLDALGDPFPYKRCPKCGSKNIRRFVLQHDGTPDLVHAPATPPIAGEEFKILCRSCGYRDAVEK
jgi:hypothetical protein